MHNEEYMYMYSKYHRAVVFTDTTKPNQLGLESEKQKQKPTYLITRMGITLTITIRIREPNCRHIRRRAHSTRLVMDPTKFQ